ncbi:amidase family protein [Sporolactobacillus spathodeae]|uniref:Amidase n=1 Tax=Sporolactobacillus spathodeae TaxID=1465502 RepID=A0ABS2Q8X5_9BACL|nr:amidase family protein [Sporolactobacillus spathodeae]MBM7658237.1 amidase [Sporolactobacillus spathodeae]
MSKKKKFALAAALTGATAAALTAGVFLRQEVAKRHPFTLDEATLSDLQKALRAGRFTAKQLTEAYLERIRQHEALNAVLEINPDALHDAEASDVKRAVNPEVGPLFGIPLLIKDNIETSGEMHTTAGALAFADYHAKQDAFLVRKLKEAGAIILGKTNLTEFANFISEQMPNGYSTLGGQTINPYGDSFDVGGSSAGTGAAIAANLAAAGIGTETSGSILSPASQNSLVGIKPTIGLVSRSGIIPLSHSQDTAGPMARTVRDAVILLNAIAGLDEEDEETVWSQGDIQKDYTVFLKRKGLKNARVGIDRAFLRSSSDEHIELINEALDVIRDEGATVVPINIPSADALENRESTVMYQEFKWDINRYLERLPESVPVHSLTELIAFNQAHASEALKYGQAVFEKAERMSGDLGEKTYLIDRADDIRLSQREGIDAVMKTHHLDALLFEGYKGSDIAAKAGYPSITVPTGYTHDGQPVGLTFCGMAFSEPKLIELAYSFEQATECRVAPASSPK